MSILLVPTGALTRFDHCPHRRDWIDRMPIQHAPSIKSFRSLTIVRQGFQPFEQVWMSFVHVLGGYRTGIV